MLTGRHWDARFQCFELVRALYRLAGIELPDPQDGLARAARAGADLFRAVDPEAEPLCVGDLLLFHRPEGPHLALVEATNRAVQVTSQWGIFRAPADRLITQDRAAVLRYVGPEHEKLAL